MYRRFYAQLAAIAALPALAGGCTQMTRHSNMIIFGTNTVVGVRVGVSATQVPSVDVGFNRQELVLMPVVANVDVDGQGHMKPCNVNGATPSPVPAGQTPQANPCVLLGTRQGAQDSYSVLASFGGHFDAASSTANGAKAQGGVSQYFATGMAAQLLALNGGAAVVSSGPAAESSSKNAPLTLEGKSGDAAVAAASAQGKANLVTYDTFQSALLVNVTGAADDNAVSSGITALEVNAGVNTPMRGKCATKAGCIAAIKNDDYGQTFNNHPAAMTDALAKWK